MNATAAEARLLTVDEARAIQGDIDTLKGELGNAERAGMADTELYRLKRGWLVGFQRALDVSRELRQERESEDRERQRRARDFEAKQDAKREAERQRSLEWLRARLGDGYVLRREVVADAEREGVIDLRAAVFHLGVRSLRGAYVHGTEHPDAGAEFWSLTARPGIDRPAAETL